MTNRWNGFETGYKAGLLLMACGAFAALFALSKPAHAQQSSAPLPLKIAVASHDHDVRSSFEFSPDGQWIAYTWSTENTVAEGLAFTSTGVPLAEGNYQKQVSITNLKTGESIVLGSHDSYNWAPIWSPDGSRVAFYSDEGGEAGIWIWEKSTGKAARFPGVIARAMFGFEVLRWSNDGKKLLAKILPEGMTLAQANALIPKNFAGREFPKVEPGQASVIVKKAGEKNEHDEKPASASTSLEDNAWTNRSLGDVAILNLEDKSVTRVASRVKPGWFEFSPDNKYVAYTSLMGFLSNTQQSQWRIFAYSIADGKTSKLGENVFLNYGIELNWSPDSKSIAYIASGQMGKGGISIINVTDGSVRVLAANAKDAPTFNNGEGEWPPLFDRSGQNIYAVGQTVSVLHEDSGQVNKVWKINVSSGEAVSVGEIPGHKIVALVTRDERRSLWSTDNGQTLWVVAHDSQAGKQGIFKIDTATGKGTAVIEDSRSYNDVFCLDGSDAASSIAFVAKDQQHLADIWILDTKTGATHQATHLNEPMEHYALGTARVIEWYGMDGQKLRGALLLPPNYQKGRRLPLVVWVYGGSLGSNYVNRFGFWGDYPQFDFHILDTRGYAILFPDTPLGEGTPMRDLMKTVIPGVDAAVQQGYADPERAAIMGQSYGSYCVLALISQTTRFKAAVITAAVLNPDLFTDYLRATGYYEHGQGNMHGTIWEFHDRYLENSPLFSFDRVQTPLLIGQGADDGDLTPSDAIFEGLKRLNKVAEYRVYEGEGHVLTKSADILDFWQRRLDFLAEHLNMAVNSDGAVLFDGDAVRPAKH